MTKNTKKNNKFKNIDPKELLDTLGIHQVHGKFLEGDDYEQMMMILKFLEPSVVTNNQRTMTEVYFHNGNAYHVHHGIEDKPLIEEVLDIRNHK